MPEAGLQPRLWDVRAIDAAIDALPGEAESVQVNPWD